MEKLCNFLLYTILEFLKVVKILLARRVQILPF